MLQIVKTKKVQECTVSQGKDLAVAAALAVLGLIDFAPGELPKR